MVNIKPTYCFCLHYSCQNGLQMVTLTNSNTLMVEAPLLEQDIPGFIFQQDRVSTYFHNAVRSDQLENRWIDHARAVDNGLLC